MAEEEDSALGYVLLDYQHDPDLTVHFTDLSTGAITRWDWDFGYTGAQATYYQPTNPNWTYPRVNNLAGYPVTLTISYGDDCSDQEVKSAYVRVTGCPT